MHLHVLEFKAGETSSLFKSDRKGDITHCTLDMSRFSYTIIGMGHNTPLYSNGEGCNPEVYELIRSVIMQEMLHMVQAANILIALNGSPVIDSKHVPGNLPVIFV